jgi:hypothetical protein
MTLKEEPVMLAANVMLFPNDITDPESVVEAVSLKEWSHKLKQNGESLGYSCFIDKNSDPEISKDLSEKCFNAAKIFLSKTNRNISDYNNPVESFMFVKYPESGAKHMSSHPDRWLDENGKEVIPDITILLYLTSDYEGGNLNFDDLDIHIKPAAGNIVIFDSSLNHSVDAILGGRRINTQMFLFKNKEMVQ